MVGITAAEARRIAHEVVGMHINHPAPEGHRGLEKLMSKSPRTEPVGGGPKGAEGFPIGNKVHARLAIGGATRSYNAGNISKSKEDEIKSAARAKLGDRVAGAR